MLIPIRDIYESYIDSIKTCTGELPSACTCLFNVHQFSSRFMEIHFVSLISEPALGHKNLPIFILMIQLIRHF